VFQEIPVCQEIAVFQEAAAFKETAMHQETAMLQETAMRQENRNASRKPQCVKKTAMRQGTTSVVPKNSQKTKGFSP
jgi:hypothetical protein